LAIVDDMPGVTRDRHYEVITWDEKKFILVDTGGFEDNPDDEMATMVKQQSLFAVEEAEIIIHLVDSKDNLSPDDETLASILRKSGKKIILGINKVDLEKHKERTGDFYKLGIKEIFFLSSEHNRGIGELLDYLVKLLPVQDLKEQTAFETIKKICIIGKPNVGKSMLLNRIIGKDKNLVSAVAGTTRDSIDTLYHKDGKEYLLIDTAGIRRKNKTSLALEKFCVIMALKSLDRSDIALLVIDAEQGVTDQDKKIATYIKEMGKACIIIVNKWDLVEKNTYIAKDYMKRIAEELKHIAYAPLITISAKSGQRVVKIFDIIDRVYEKYAKELSTSQLNKIMTKIIAIRPPPSSNGRHIKFFTPPRSTLNLRHLFPI
jgi:GTP-binding protein